MRKIINHLSMDFPIYEICGYNGIVVREYTYFELNKVWYFRNRITIPVWGNWQRSATARLLAFDHTSNVVMTPLGPARFLGMRRLKVGILPH